MRQNLDEDLRLFSLMRSRGIVNGKVRASMVEKKQENGDTFFNAVVFYSGSVLQAKLNMTQQTTHQKDIS